MYIHMCVHLHVRYEHTFKVDLFVRTKRNGLKQLLII